ncbi:MAG: two-component response regulator [Candidatus Rokubacteria bacterium CSP1-6]|nr:MAG: two-component response regulator [Candidatus Rokubacteria bacterium CSP1-6]
MAPLVLIVEDIEDNLILIKSLLELADYRVVEARDGREALAQAQAHHPDLILLDMSLPEIDGWTVARTLRQLPDFRSTLIVALTAHAMHGDREKTLEAGCDEFMTKPIDVPSFVPAVTKILEGQRG